MKADQPYGTFNGPAEVRLVRRLPGPIERIWDYLTDPDKRARWFAGGPMEARAGGKVELHFQHKCIAPDETPPAPYQEMHEKGMTLSETILRWEPPHVLSYTFDEECEVTFELSADGDQVLLVLTHRTRNGEPTDLSGYASGWHVHFAILIAILEGTPRPPFWATHAQLKAHYQAALADLKA